MADEESVEPIELVFVEGALAGQRIAVPENGPFVLGRTRKGLDLQDALVSLEHAEITFRAGQGYLITDLGSQSGTYVDGRPVSPGPVRIKVGSRIALGESVAYVEEAVDRPSIRPVLGIFGIVVLLGLGAGFVVLGQTSPRDWRVGWREPLRMADGTAIQGIDLPDAFVRETGLSPGSFRVDRIGDVDGDHIDELWLTTVQGSQWIVEVAAPGQLELLGKLPSGCRVLDYGERTAFDCGGDLWAWTGTEIRPYSSEGVVVLVDSEFLSEDKSQKHTERVLLRVGSGPPEQIAGFLGARGVNDPVHYLLCEGAVSGARAQVLTAMGRVEALDFGCLDDLSLMKAPVEDGYRIVRVLAVAFTANGRQALADDLQAFSAGGLESPFLAAEDRPLLDRLRSAPVSRQVRRLQFEAEPSFFEAVAPEVPISGVRLWLPNGERPDRPAPSASTVTLAGLGDVEIPAGGCSRLKVHTQDWSCELSSLCFPNRDFLEVRQVGCGHDEVLVRSAYGAGTSVGGDAELEIAATVETAAGRGRVDVTRAQLTWRLRAKP